MSVEVMEARELGDEAYEKRDFFTAHVFYDAAIRISPREMVLYFNKSAIFFAEGKYDECIATCKKALDVGSEDKTLISKVIYRVTQAMMAQGKEPEAFAYLKRTSAEHGMIANVRFSAGNRHLSFAYQRLILASIIEIDEAGARTRNLVFSSPEMTADFVKLMSMFTISIRDYARIQFFNWEKKSIKQPTLVKKWSGFSWIAPFITRLSIIGAPPDGRPPKWAYEMLPRTSKDLYVFQLWLRDWIHDPLHPNLLPFIRRQLPNLRELQGPIELFLELPPNPAVPKSFRNAGLVIREFSDFTKLFKTTRFTSPEIEFKFVHLPYSDFDFANSFTAFLKDTKIRLLKTTKMTIRLPIMNAQFPAGDLVKALYTVFPKLFTLDFHCLLPASGGLIAYDRKRPTEDFKFLIQQMKKMPHDLRVNFYVDESVDFATELCALNAIVHCPSGFTELDDSNQNPWNPSSEGFVNKKSRVPVCHDNKYIHYEIMLNRP